MNGKSFLLRALQHGAPGTFPSPIPAPGAKGHNHASTSSNINLYADWKTVDDVSPILFLDCEGFEGSEVPTSLAAKAKKSTGIKLGIRRNFVDNAYPRFVYAFSTCVVFVTSGPLAESADIGRKLLSYATQGAGGSRNQGFKPSLFVVFNRFDGGNTSNFDWSIPASMEAFLKHDQLKDLELYYETIHVVYIPSVNTNKSDIALSQIDAFHTMLRDVHTKAFRRRRDFRLVFPPEKLEHFLWRALIQFSNSRRTIFNWSTETAYQRFQTGFLNAALHDLWVQYSEYYSYETRSSRNIYRRTRATFEKHVQFCTLISLTRNPPHGERVGTLPESLGVLVKGVGELVLEFAPCGAVANKHECDEIRDRHGEHHQGKGTDSKVYRWVSPYEEDKEFVEQTFRRDLKAVLKASGTMPPASLRMMGK
ncbi:hypothetical protein BDZ94DRAFT_1315735 [Collybia nuda]|uniref:Uncharacterized protein n=1 Tax=Collybia nuda TaxID=64659 RepID=A0A9P6C859_9AGAR|nr:hypothetical protein BDZ94DRAFT_1315735 [Collybia nuda]